MRKHRQQMAAALVIVVGFALSFFGCRELRLGWKCQREPKSLTAQQLIDSGPGDNYHVLVTNFIPGQEFLQSGEKTAYVPIRPPGMAKIDILLQTEVEKTAIGIPLLPIGNEIQGVVISDIADFNADQRNALKKLGPINFEKCWVIDHNRKPPGWLNFLLKLGGGLALVAAGSLWFWQLGTDGD